MCMIYENQSSYKDLTMITIWHVTSVSTMAMFSVFQNHLCIYLGKLIMYEIIIFQLYW